MFTGIVEELGTVKKKNKKRSKFSSIYDTGRENSG